MYETVRYQLKQILISYEDKPVYGLLFVRFNPYTLTFYV